MNFHRPAFSLATLQVFVAVARLGSFTRAAESVHLTQSAVSKHIALLEDNLGVPLLTRAGGVALTEPGRQFLQAVEPALEQILRAAERIASPPIEQQMVSLLAPPAVLQFWLISLLPRFAREHPEIDLRLTPRLLSTPSSRLDLDAEIRFGSGMWQGVRARYLFGREMCVVAAPALLAAHRIAEPADLHAVRRLSHVLYPSAWSEWSQAMGAGLELPPAGQAYDHYSVMIEALHAQLGVGIVPRLLVRKHLASGELAAPFDEVMVGSSGYYLVLRDGDGQAPAALRTVGDWLKARADELVQEWLSSVSISVAYQPARGPARRQPGRAAPRA
ncbi:LysR substrate-binding domain-containing protein [Orrella sp. JC864]|uniref:LysR substrate-binding domain-containing protein n=1 Tax=Orrella sp. JC864 TaxID=3120298 RepID=UPI00300A65B8